MPNLNNFPIHHILLFLISLYLIYTLLRLQNNQMTNQNIQHEHFDYSRFYTIPVTPIFYSDWTPYTFQCYDLGDKLESFTIQVNKASRGGQFIGTYNANIAKYNTDIWKWNGNLADIPGIGDPSPGKSKNYKIIDIKCKSFCPSGKVFRNNTCYDTYTKNLSDNIYNNGTPYLFKCDVLGDRLKSFSVTIYNMKNQIVGTYLVDIERNINNNMNEWTWNADLENIPGIGDPLKYYQKKYKINFFTCIRVPQ